MWWRQGLRLVQPTAGATAACQFAAGPPLPALMCIIRVKLGSRKVNLISSLPGQYVYNQEQCASSDGHWHERLITFGCAQAHTMPKIQM